MSRLFAIFAAGAAACGDNATWQCGGRAELLYGGSVWGENLTAANGRVYFTTYDEDPDLDDHQVQSVSASCGGAPQILWSGGSHELFGAGMVVAGDQVVFSEMTSPDSGPPGIFTVPVGGGDRSLLGTPSMGGGFYSGFASDGTAVYLQNGRAIERLPLDGTAPTTIGPPSSVDAAGVDSFVLRGGSLFFTVVEDPSAPSTSLFELDVETQLVRTLGSVDTNGGQFDVADSVVYMPSAAGVAVVSRVGDPTTRVGDPATAWRDVIVGPDGFYGFSGDAIVWMPLAGGAPSVLVDRVANLATLARDDSTVYAASLAMVYALHGSP